jgi:alkylated DNA repair dioxygenase AlkB
MGDFSAYALDMPQADVWYYRHAFSAEESKQFFELLHKEIQWRADQVRIFGKWIDQPRLTALYAENSHPYTYSGLTLHPTPFTPLLDTILTRVKAVTAHDFSSCLLNLYRDGNDSNGWHADDEKELGKNPVIASVSFGQDRIFHFRHKNDRSLKTKVVLENGSILLMKGSTQHHWQHQLPKSKRKMDPRINLTFRNIL